MKKKWVTVGIILLSVGIAIAPTINFQVVKASTDDNLVEVTTQAYGIQGYGNTTVKLTREQYQDLEKYLVEFRARLNQTSTKKETILLFKETIIELNKYGLLPQGMNSQKAMRLATGNFQLHNAINMCRIVTEKLQLMNDSNFFCLITGTTSGTCVISIAEQGAAALIYLVTIPYILADMLGHEPVVIENIITRLRETCNFLRQITDSRVIQTGNIVFGTSIDEYIPPEFRYFPAHGWIDTQGLLGKKTWNGTFFGSIRSLTNFEFRDYTYYIGATGFIGIKIIKEDGSNFFLGSALYVDLDYFEF